MGEVVKANNMRPQASQWGKARGTLCTHLKKKKMHEKKERKSYSKKSPQCNNSLEKQSCSKVPGDVYINTNNTFYSNRADWASATMKNKWKKWNSSQSDATHRVTQNMTDGSSLYTLSLKHIWHMKHCAHWDVAPLTLYHVKYTSSTLHIDALTDMVIETLWHFNHWHLNHLAQWQ